MTIQGEKQNVIQDKSFAYAVRVVNAYKHLVSTKSEYVLSKQFLRSGTSIGANVEEALGVQRRLNFCRNYQFLIKKLEKIVIGLD